MTHQVFNLPPQQPLSAAGRVLPGSKLYFYITNTSTPTPVYTTAALSVAHSQPLIADAGGRFATVYLDPTITYKATVTSAADVLLYTVDPVNDQILSQGVIGGYLFPRTTAETAAAITPTNYAYPQLNLRRYGGAPGAGDNTAAMNAAEAVCAQLNGGSIIFDTVGDWRMNWACTTNGITLQGPGGGSGEFDEACIRPYSLTSAPITVGDGVTQLRYFRMSGCHVSGTDGSGGADLQSAKSAPQCIRLYGVTHARFNDCVFYNGILTIDAQSSATIPTFDIRMLDCKVRNDLSDSNNAACFNFVSVNDTGFLRDINLIGCKVEGPDLGYAYKLDGTSNGFSIMLIGGYTDQRAGHGVYLGGATAIRSWGHDLDCTDGTGNVIVTTDQAQSDPARILFGYLTQAGQRIQFNGTALDSGTLQGAASTTATLRAAAAFADNELAGQVLRILTGTGAGQERQIASNVGVTDVVTLASAWATTPDSSSTYSIAKTILLLAEGDHFLYRARLNNAFLSSVTYLSTLTDPYNQGLTLEVLSSTGPVNFAGTDFGVSTAGKGLRVKEGSNCKQGTATLVAGSVVVSNTSVTANSRIFLSRSTLGGTPGHLSYTISAGASFTITSSSGTDTSVINYQIFEPA